MPVKSDQPMGWTDPAATVSFWLVVNEQRERTAEVVKAGRKAQGWSVEKLASEAKVSSKTIQRLEDGKTENPRGHTIQSVASALKLTREDLVGTPPSVASVRETKTQLDRMEDSLTEIKLSLRHVLTAQQRSKVVRDLRRASAGATKANAAQDRRQAPKAADGG